MANQPVQFKDDITDIKQQSLFARLKKLFSTDVIVRNVGGKQIKIKDTDNIMYATDRNSLRDRFNRIRSTAWNANSRDFSLSYQAARLDLFRDYDTMDMDPIISSVLDIYADECLTLNELKQMLVVHSKNSNIKGILNNLFYDILNIEGNMWSWTRNLCKYGDFFLRLYIAPEYGIYMVEPISPYNVERIENSDPYNKRYVKFQIRPTDTSQAEVLENYEIAHFRLLSDTNFIPYGKAMIEGGRRVWKQLSLMEDAMLIHRIMRAPERRIFKIDIGNIPPNEVDPFMEKMINKVKKVPYIDEQTGDYNLRFNLQSMTEDFYLPVRGGDSGTEIDTLSGMEWTGIEDLDYVKNKMMAAFKIPKAFLGYEEGLCISPNTLIPLLNGKEKTVKELIKDHSNGIKNFVYSIDETTKNIVPGEIEWAGYTRKNADVVRVWLDNGKYVDCTPDHNFLTRDGKWIEAQNLISGQSLMPLYLKKSTRKDRTGYEMVYHPSTGNYQEVHRLVTEHYNMIHPKSGKVVHHKDFNKLNNYPDNLDCSMSFMEHRKYHSNLTKVGINSPKNIKKRINDPKWRASVKLAGKKGGLISGKHLGNWVKLNGPSNKGIRTGYNKICPICNSNFYTTKTLNTTTCSIKCGSQYFTGVKKYNTKFSKVSFEELLLAASKSRSFKELEKNLGGMDRNTLLRVFKIHGILDKHEFVIKYMPLAISNHRFMNNFLSAKKNHKVVKVEFIVDKMDTCDITVKQYHNFAVSSGVIIHNSGKATLASEDVRFARTIQRIQRILISELSKIAIIHLYSQGYRDETLVDFELELTNPSTVFEREKIEIWSDKVELATDMMEGKLFSKDWLYKNIFNMSDEDKLVVGDQILEDTKQQYRLNSIEEVGHDPAKPVDKIGSGDMIGGPEGGPGGGTDVEDLLGGGGPEGGPGGELKGGPGGGPEGLKEFKKPERDQTGRKDSNQYPFGEDELGSLERNSTSDSDRDPFDRPRSPARGFNESVSNKPKLDTGIIKKLHGFLNKTLIEEQNELKAENEITSSDSKSLMDERNIRE